MQSEPEVLNLNFLIEFHHIRTLRRVCIRVTWQVVTLNVLSVVVDEYFIWRTFLGENDLIGVRDDKLDRG